MSFGKVYFYDRSGNKVPSEPVSAPSVKTGGSRKDRERKEKKTEEVEDMELSKTFTAAPNNSSPVPNGFQPRTYNVEPAEEQENSQISSSGEKGGSGMSELPALSRELLDNLVEDEDLCDDCRWRDIHNVVVTAHTAEEAAREKGDEQAVVAFMKEKQKEGEEREKAAALKSKQLSVHIREFNQKLAEEKRNARNDDENEGGYLLFKRPDTASVSREKQRALREDLDRQMDTRSLIEQEQRMVAKESFAHNQESFQEVNREEGKEKYRASLMKQEYRRALDAQIAARAAEHAKVDSRRPWWSTATEMRDERHISDQSERLAKQEAAVHNLEEFKRSEKEEEEQKRMKRQGERRTVVPESSEVPSRMRAEALVERQKVVEEAWAKAAAEKNAKVDVLRKDQGGALLDQLRKYKRCRKCQKAIIHQAFAKNGGEAYVMDVKQGTMRQIGDERLIKPRSRHF